MLSTPGFAHKDLSWNDQESISRVLRQLDSPFEMCGFGISYGIGQKYQKIWVSVLDLNQNSGFGHTLTKYFMLGINDFFFLGRNYHRLSTCYSFKA